MVKKRKIHLKEHPIDGVVLQLHHTILEAENKVRRIKFVSACFDQIGEKLACSDHRGNIFVCDLLQREYWKLLTTGHTVLRFHPSQNDTVIVVNVEPPYVVSSLHIENAINFMELRGHKLKPVACSFSTNCKYAITSSPAEAVIWDLVTHLKYFVLKASAEGNIKQIEFTPRSNFIVSCFSNGFIKMWKFDSLTSVDKFPSEIFENSETFSFTISGRVMAVGGKTSKLMIMNMDTFRSKCISLASFQIAAIKHIQFLPGKFDGGANKILLLLSNDCVLHFYNMEQETLVYSLSCESNIKRVIVNPTGKYLTCLLKLGEVNVYKTSVLEDKFIKININKSKQSASSKVVRLQHLPNIGHNEFKHIKSAERNKIIDEFNRNKLREILLYYNEYPEKHRKTLWKMLLCIPTNRNVYTSIANRPVHPVYSSMGTYILMENKIFVEHLKRLLSSLAYWSPVISESDYIIQFLFPFVKTFYKDPMFCFELSATILLNYCQHWFDYTPLLPINILSMIENMISYFDRSLLDHFCNCNITSDIYAWNVLKTGFSEVLLISEWMVLWDHILSNEPHFLLIAVVTYNIVNRNALLRFHNIENFKTFFISQNPIVLKSFIKKCYLLMRELPGEIHPQKYFKPITYLDKGDCYIQIPQKLARIEASRE